MDYFDHPSLENVYLEDSFVLGLQVEPNRVSLTIELVLREAHPLFREPAEDEQYCYRRACIVYEGVRQVAWKMPAGPVAFDAADEIDYGGIERYTIENDEHCLFGEIGEVALVSDAFFVEILD